MILPKEFLKELELHPLVVWLRQETEEYSEFLVIEASEIIFPPSNRTLKNALQNHWLVRKLKRETVTFFNYGEGVHFDPKKLKVYVAPRASVFESIIVTTTMISATVPKAPKPLNKIADFYRMKGKWDRCLKTTPELNQAVFEVFDDFNIAKE
jgi:hypothetical protein